MTIDIGENDDDCVQDSCIATCSDEEIAHINYITIDKLESRSEYSLHISLPSGTFDYVVDRLEDIDSLDLPLRYSILVDLRHVLLKVNLSGTIYLNDGDVVHTINCSLPPMGEVLRLDAYCCTIYYVLHIGDERIALELIGGYYHTDRGIEYGVMKADHIEGVYSWNYCCTNDILDTYRTIGTYTAIRQDKRQLMCNEIAGMFNT